MKKYIYFFSIGFFVILFGVFVVFQFRPSTNTPVLDTNRSQINFSLKNKILVVKKISKLNDLFLFDPRSPKTVEKITNTEGLDEQKAIMSNDYKTIFYSASSHDVFSLIQWDIAKNLQETLVISEYPIVKIICSPDDRHILYSIQKDEMKTEWYFMDSKTKRSSALPNAIVQTAWINDSQIIFETNEENIEVIYIEKNATLGESRIILEKAKNPIIVNNSLITLQFIENNWRFVQTNLRGEDQVVYSPFNDESAESIPYDTHPLGDHQLVFKRMQGLWLYDLETNNLREIDTNVDKIMITPDNSILTEKSYDDSSILIRYISPLYAADRLDQTEYFFAL